MKGRPHRFRIDGKGRIFEHVRKGVYKLAEAQLEEAVPILPSEIMYPLEEPEGCFMRTHKAVNHVACTYCGSKVGQACMGCMGDRIGGTHTSRREDYAEWKRKTRSAGADRHAQQTG